MQPAARWHGDGEGPCQYFADTPDGAWAEFLRHEGISEAEALELVERALWAAEIPDAGYEEPDVSEATLKGGYDSYAECQDAARRIRVLGAIGLVASSAALKPGAAGGWQVNGGVVRGSPREGKVHVLFGPQPAVRGWLAALGRPSEDLLPLVNHLPSRESR